MGEEALTPTGDKEGGFPATRKASREVLAGRVGARGPVGLVGEALSGKDSGLS